MKLIHIFCCVIMLSAFSCAENNKNTDADAYMIDSTTVVVQKDTTSQISSNTPGTNAPNMQTQPANAPEQQKSKLMAIDKVAIRVDKDYNRAIALLTGTLPDECTRPGEMRQDVKGKTINITLFEAPNPVGAPPCPGKLKSLPLRHGVPIDLASLPHGTYKVIVNGKSASFDW